MDKQEWKTRKKAYRRAKHRAIRPWKGLSIVSAILAVLLLSVYGVLDMFDNTLALFVGGTFWELENEDKEAQYYTSDFDSEEELTEYGTKIARQVEAEGAALLMNENQALPLAEGASVSCFSGSSVNLVYGGTGSGNVDASKADTLKGALKKSGFQVNEKLWDFYSKGDGAEYLTGRGGTVTTTSATTSEVPWSVYTDEVVDSVASYGDAAIVVLSRVGGEGADLEYDKTNYLALDDDEKDMLDHIASLKEQGIVKKVVVLINSANPLQVDFLKDNIYNVDACLWIGDVGGAGINAVADILAGKVNPSGSLVDTYCYDNYSSPAMRNFTPVTYGGYKEGLIPENASTYMIYQEGIYVGYKYYETRYEDTVMGKGNAGDYVYGDAVAFPFGYGLSYTDFAYSNMGVSYNATTDQFEVKVTVTNTGDTYVGKETVQIYAQSPYTQYDIDHKVEKASVALCGFGKTKELAPGEAEELTITVDRRELASYDAYNAGTYILDAGDYYLTAAADAHNAVNNILAAKGYSTADGMDADGNAQLTYQWNNPSLDTTTYSTSKNGTKIENQLSGSDINLYEGNETQVTYLTRNDWTGTFPKEPVQLALTDVMVEDLQDIQYDPADYEKVEMPTLGAKNGLKLYDMIGLEYDDPKWEDLLDQLTFDEMVSLIGDAFHWTMPVKSVEAPGSRDENGPQGLTATLFGASLGVETTAFTSEDVMAATFNLELMEEVGKVIGNDCLNANVACLYGPGNNIHRTPYGGRNFEYYSEDGFLSGKISAAEVKAIQDKGVHVVMKHFALNDSEQDRIGLGVWLGEQAAREIYLKAFQIPFEEGNANGTMVAYTRWGCIWSGGNKGLMTNIMREEWGSNGMTITDNVLTSYVNGADGVMAGVSIYDAMLPFVTNLFPKYENDPVIVSAMRKASHHNLYAIAHSVAMNGVGEDTVVKPVRPQILNILQIAGIIFAVLFVVSLILYIVRRRKFVKSPDYLEFRAYKKQKK